MKIKIRETLARVHTHTHTHTHTSNLKNKRILLIITIIMLIILAVISILALSNLNLFNETKKSKELTAYKSEIELIYEEKEINRLNVELFITITSTDGIVKIEMPDKDVIKCNEVKEKVGIDYTIKYDTDYKIKITTAKGEEIEKIICVERKNDIVQYTAGDWTLSEIQQLQNLGLYNLNENILASEEIGLNFTFGGFTNKESDDVKENIIMSKDKSIAINSPWGLSLYDGWKVMESYEENGRKYVTKLIHCGCPENFVFNVTTGVDSYRAEYLLSGGERQINFNTFENGTKINARNWDMYRDKNLEQKGYIKDVHCMTFEEAQSNSTIRFTGYHYWLASNYSRYGLWAVLNDNNTTLNSAYNYIAYCWGIRPVITLSEGVYIESGEGTQKKPYILTKD